MNPATSNTNHLNSTYTYLLLSDFQQRCCYHACSWLWIKQLVQFQTFCCSSYTRNRHRQVLNLDIFLHDVHKHTIFPYSGLHGMSNYNYVINNVYVTMEGVYEWDTTVDYSEASDISFLVLCRTHFSSDGTAWPIRILSYSKDSNNEATHRSTWHCASSKHPSAYTL